MFRGRRRKGTRAVVILQGTTASHHGDQEAGKEDHEEDHEEDHDLRSLAAFTERKLREDSIGVLRCHLCNC